MTFAQPAFLMLGLFIVPLAVGLMIWARQQRQKGIDRLGERPLIARLTGNRYENGRKWKGILQIVALALLLIALARPQWGTEVREIEQEGLQVMIALDVSQSMLAEDMAPNRLERAKLEIADLTERLEGDEIGLVLFSGASFVQVPLTSDYQTALNYLDSAGPQTISRPGTVIGDAINTAVTAFDPNLNSQKVLIVMTDGEDPETNPIDAAQKAADAGVLIYTIGFGTTAGEAVPETNEYGQIIGYKTGMDGQLAISRLDEATLQEIAAIGGGDYYHASAGANELDSLLNEIDNLQREQLQSRFETTYIERFQIFLAVSGLLLLASMLVPERKRKQRRRDSLRNWKLKTTKA